MGRHSAPDDDDEGLDERSSGAATATSVLSGTPGRHAGGDGSRPRPAPVTGDDEPSTDEPSADGLAFLEGALDGSPAADVADVGDVADIAEPAEVTATIAPVTDEPAGAAPDGAPPPLPQQPAPPATRSPSGAHATRHDLALVMRHGDVRARVLAAVLGPFVVYVAVLAVVDALTVHSLIWVWAPAVVAGVLVGLVLDAGHRHHPVPDEPAGAPLSGPADPH